jgi:hypothetical protein
MNTYYFEGTARQVGALGVTHFFNAEVQADTKDEAIRKLYDQWEHIHLDGCSEWTGHAS